MVTPIRTRPTKTAASGDLTNIALASHHELSALKLLFWKGVSRDFKMILQFIENKQYLLNLFAEIPQVDKFELCNVQFDRNGPTAELTLTTDRVPQTLPRRYQGQSLNASSLVLALVPINHVSLSAWGTVNVGTFAVKEVGDELDIQFFTLPATDPLLELTCRFVDLKSWTPYLREAA